MHTFSVVVTVIGLSIVSIGADVDQRDLLAGLAGLSPPCSAPAKAVRWANGQFTAIPQQNYARVQMQHGGVQGSSR